MNPILVKIFATALTFSQVTTRPDAVRTEFDPLRDRAEVVEILRDGCTHMRKAFGIEDIDLDGLIATAMEDPQAVAGDVKILQGVNLGELHASYRQFCKNETVEPSPVDVGAVIAYYNAALRDLPDHTALKGRTLPGVSLVLDGKGEPFAEVFEADARRISVPLREIPEHVRQAFIAAEDKRFREHRGIDERGVIRAFIGNLSRPGRPQGGSTITQQVAKNLVVGDDVTYDRKMREMIVAARIEKTLSKDEILELYLNTIYLGRASWGVEMAARSWFGKSAKELTLAEGALLAGLTKGPNYYSPDRQPERAQERFAYVLSRMQEDGVIAADEMKRLAAERPRTIAWDRLRREAGFHFVDHVARDVRTLAGIERITAGSYTVRSTLLPALQREAEAALQEGLARYELNTGRFHFAGPEMNLTEAIQKLETAAPPGSRPAWQRALEQARLPLYDVHWPAAVVVEKRRGKDGDVIRVGLKDGRILPLTTWRASIRQGLKLHDVVHVRVVETKGRKGQPGAQRAELRVRPTVQGAAIVLENKTGRILAMVGGFSYPLSQLNRATQAHRQPGSALKPLTYLAALATGLQPNTLVWDAPVALPPIGGSGDYWMPKNYDGAASGLVTLRRALENSKNLVTARLLDGGIAAQPDRSLARVCELALEAQLYVECERYYPFVLGAQPVRLVDLAAFYAAIANEGLRPAPYAVEAVEQGGRELYRRTPRAPVAIGSADRVAFYQLKSILQGVLERGTGRPIRHLAPYVAGKTGTTDQENDAWFVGFTNEVTVAVWVGHDNADGKRRTLGRGQTGGKVALPIFERIIEAAWTHHAPRTPLAPPSPEVEKQLIALPIDLQSGERVHDRRAAFMEHFRLDRSGRLAETQYRLVPEARAYALRRQDPWDDGEAAGGWGDGFDRGPYAQPPRPAEPYPIWPGQPRGESRPWLGPYGQTPWYDDDERFRRRPRRVDPDYPWGRWIY